MYLHKQGYHHQHQFHVKQKYFLIRLVQLTAHHDKGISGINDKVLDSKAFSDSLNKLISANKKKLTEKDYEDSESQLKIGDTDKLIVKNVYTIYSTNTIPKYLSEYFTYNI